jgi:NAD(P)-dependent dehydrogenase (short-subunit alcohol dehydrogenase family)
MTSSVSISGNPGQLNYAAAKAGIAAMTLVAAQELDRYGVRVNAIAPVARTRLTLQTPGWGEKLTVEDGAFDVWAPENVTPLVAWLASADSTMTGQVFSIVGGHIGWQEGWTEKESFDVSGRAWTEDELTGALAKLPQSYTAFPA